MDTRSLTAPKENRSFRRRLSRYGPVVLWLIFISFASTGEFSADNTSRIIGPILVWLFPRISAERLAFIHAIVRKIAHFSEYAILGLLAARLFRTSSKNILRRNWFGWSMLLITTYALLDEYHQSFVPSRTASLLDSLIDAVGGLTALLVINAWSHRKRDRSSL